jgi:hypothetical protein
MAVFWDFTQCSLVNVTDISKEITASIIRVFITQ